MREASRKAFLHWKKILKLKNLNMEELVREKSELLEEALKSQALLTSRVAELDGQLALVQENQDEAVDAATRSIQARAGTLSNSMAKLAEQLAAETGQREAVEARLQQAETTVAGLEVSIRDSSHWLSDGLSVWLSDGPNAVAHPLLGFRCA